MNYSMIDRVTDYADYLKTSIESKDAGGNNVTVNASLAVLSPFLPYGQDRLVESRRPVCRFSELTDSGFKFTVDRIPIVLPCSLFNLSNDGYPFIGCRSIIIRLSLVPPQMLFLFLKFR